MARACVEQIRLRPKRAHPLRQIKARPTGLLRMVPTSFHANPSMAPILTASPDPRTRPYAAKLVQRQAELRMFLQSAAGAAVGAADNRPELLDFKDVAAEDTRAKVDEVALSNASEELNRVVAALRHIDDGTYGYCEDCGEPIDERRLMALPATRFCTACQAIHERPAVPRR